MLQLSVVDLCDKRLQQTALPSWSSQRQYRLASRPVDFERGKNLNKNLFKSKQFQKTHQSCQKQSNASFTLNSAWGSSTFVMIRLATKVFRFLRSGANEARFPLVSWT